MPRKKGTKRSRTKGRKVSRRKTNMPSFVHRYCRFATSDPGIWMQGGLGTSYYFGADTFSLTEMQNYSQLLSIYEYFKIKSVELTFKWVPQVSVGAGNNTSAFSPILWLKEDRVDNTVPTGIGELKSGANTRQIVLYPNRQYKHKIKNLNILVRGYESATSDAFVPKKNQRIDMVDAATPHYPCVKMCAEAPDGSINYGNVEYTIKFVIDCYNPK